MLLLLNQVLRFVSQPVITLKQQKYHYSVPLKKNDPNQSRDVKTNSKANGTKAKLVYFFTKILVVVNIMYAQKERIFSLGVRLYCMVIFITDPFSRLAARRMLY